VPAAAYFNIKRDPQSAATKYCMLLLHVQLAAQVILFLLAGYETTANSLSFLSYYLSTHPEAQQKLQQEVDTVLGGRAPTLEDLPKVRQSVLPARRAAASLAVAAVAILYELKYPPHCTDVLHAWMRCFNCATALAKPT
jgi:cytochrome P450